MLESRIKPKKMTSLYHFNKHYCEWVGLKLCHISSLWYQHTKMQQNLNVIKMERCQLIFFSRTEYTEQTRFQCYQNSYAVVITI